MADETMTVEVAYAAPDDQALLSIQVPVGATVEEAIEQSGILRRFPEIDLDGVNKVGVFGKLRKRSDVLCPYDRVEIYRPLKADPKEARRRRAAGRAE